MLNPLTCGRFYRPITHIGIKWFLFIHIALIKFEGARPETGLKINPFSKIKRPKSQFLNIYQKFLL